MVRLSAAANLALGAVAIATALLLASGDARGEEDWRNLYLDAKPVLDVRYRFEYVDRRILCCQFGLFLLQLNVATINLL